MGLTEESFRAGWLYGLLRVSENCPCTGGQPWPFLAGTHGLDFLGSSKIEDLWRLLRWSQGSSPMLVTKHQVLQEHRASGVMYLFVVGSGCT